MFVSLVFVLVWFFVVLKDYSIWTASLFIVSRLYSTNETGWVNWNVQSRRRYNMTIS